MYLKDEWVQVGTVPVDSGQVCISDPCYVRDYEGDVLPVALAAIKEGKDVYEVNGDCIISGTTHGDGLFPVYARYNERGRVTALMVDLDPADEDEWDDYNNDYYTEEEDEILEEEKDIW